MTRINVIPVEDLHYKHLVAEYRELPRIFNYVRKAQERGECSTDPRIPTIYTMGTGHCRFFYNKLLWLSNRLIELTNEMKRRGYKTSYETDKILEGIDPQWINDWTPTQESIIINRNRINERLEGMNNGISKKSS